MLKKIHITNYRVFEDFKLEFNSGLNIIVGDNDAGKSTLLEAINLALTGRLRGKLLSNELSPHLFNGVASRAYVDAIKAGGTPVPPEIVVDLYLEDLPETASLRGRNNALREDSPGLRVKVSFNSAYDTEYKAFIADAASVNLVPTEYYRVDWLSFAGDTITPRSVPTTAALIDASSIRLQGGADYYLQQIIAECLDPAERVELARAYRSLREQFSEKQAIEDINKKLEAARDMVSRKKFSLSIDISSKTAWESSLIPHLDDLPIQFVGKGDQSMLKILLALDKRLKASHVVLVEEPENHLSPGSLNGLVKEIAGRCEEKQVFITTHSSYVLNKLGLDNLILLHQQSALRLDALPEGTKTFFKRLSGYDTLRVVLAKRVILVEGPSDDLIVQRAYLAKHDKLPLEDGVDVIEARGLTFKRFLDIALPLGKPVAVVTDNDGKTLDEVRDRYQDYLAPGGSIELHAGDASDGHTLEPQLLAHMGRPTLNTTLGKAFATNQELLEHMTANKTEVALKIFETAGDFDFPKYINDAVA